MSTLWLTTKIKMVTVCGMSLNSQALSNLGKTGSTHVKPSVITSDKLARDTSYEGYMRSEEWASLKKESAIWWGDKCLVCTSEKNVERHHLFYREDLYEGRSAEIVPLCTVCHEAAHVDGANKNGKPTTKDDLKSIVNRLFYTIVRQRKLATHVISQAHTRFWRRFPRDFFNKPKKRLTKVQKLKEEKRIGKIVKAQNQRERLWRKSLWNRRS